MPSNAILTLGGVAVVLLLIYLIGHGIFTAGGDSIKAGQATAQIQINEKARIRHEKTAKNAPSSADFISGAKWVQQYTRTSQ